MNANKIGRKVGGSKRVGAIGRARGIDCTPRKAESRCAIGEAEGTECRPRRWRARRPRPHGQASPSRRCPAGCTRPRTPSPVPHTQHSRVDSALLHVTSPDVHPHGSQSARGYVNPTPYTLPSLSSQASCKKVAGILHFNRLSTRLSHPHRLDPSPADTEPPTTAQPLTRKDVLRRTLTFCTLTRPSDVGTNLQGGS